VLGVAYVIGRLIASLITNVLAGVGFNTFLAQIGLRTAKNDSPSSPAAIVGWLALVVIMLFAAAEAATMLGFATVTVLVSQFMVFMSHILVGLVILALALYLANVAASAILTSRLEQATFLAVGARVALIIFGVAMALRQMGLANEIINLAFGLVLGSAAAALAIAFGFGGRDFASRQLESWSTRLGQGRQAPAGRPQQ